MKHLAVALIVLGLMAGDFLAQLWLDDETAHSWAVVNTIALILAVVWFFHHRDRHGPFVG